MRKCEHCKDRTYDVAFLDCWWLRDWSHCYAMTWKEGKSAKVQALYLEISLAKPPASAYKYAWPGCNKACPRLVREPRGALQYGLESSATSEEVLFGLTPASSRCTLSYYVHSRQRTGTAFGRCCTAHYRESTALILRSRLTNHCLVGQFSEQSH